MLKYQKLKCQNKETVEKRLKPQIRRLTKHKSSECYVQKNAWQCYKDKEISKQKCLLVQVAGFYWKHKPVTNANILAQAKVSLKNII